MKTNNKSKKGTIQYSLLVTALAGALSFIVYKKFNSMSAVYICLILLNILLCSSIRYNQDSQL